MKLLSFLKANPFFEGFIVGFFFCGIIALAMLLALWIFI